MSTPTDVGTWNKVQIFEYGRRKLGYGDYDDTTNYHRWCAKEAGKLASVMKRRRVTPEDFVLAVDYCAAHHFTITDPVGVLHHINAAQDWRKEQQSETYASDLAREIAEAIEVEKAAPYPDELWIARLARARGSYRQDALDAWREAKQLEASHDR